MTKANRRGWLDKISKWILDVFPGDSNQQQQPPSTQTARPTTTPTRSPFPSIPKAGVMVSSAQVREHSTVREQPSSATEQSDEGLPLVSEELQATEQTTEKTLIKAWRAFELAWRDAGLSPHYFLDADDLSRTLSVLDQSFEEELIEWLYQICTQPEALTDLAAIIERGQVRPTDNVDAIRAFAYVSVAVVSRPVLPTPKQPESFQVDQATCKTTTAAATPQAETTLVDRADEELAALESPETAIRSGVPNHPLEELGLSMRCYNALKRNNIHHLLDLAGKSEEVLLDIKNFGSRSVTEVGNALEKLGLRLPFAASAIAGQPPRSHDGTTHETPPGSGTTADRLGDLKNLGLSSRTLNCLYRGKVFSITELIRCTESDLLSFLNLGQSALDEIHKALAHRDLALAVPSPAMQQSDSVSVNPEQLDYPSEEAWNQLRQRALDQYEKSFLNEAQLIELFQTNPENPASSHLQDLLVRLQVVMGYLADHLLTEAESTSSELGLSLNALQSVLFGRLLGDSLANAQTATDRLSRSLMGLKIRNWEVYLQRCAGKTLSSLAEDLNISRERVRNLESKVIKVIGVNPSDLIAVIKESQIARDDAAELKVIQHWISHLGRLPIPEDGPPIGDSSPMLWGAVAGMNLKDRIDLYAKHQQPLTDKEFDYHYVYVANQKGVVGAGFWQDFENLRQFVIRHALVLGQPELMPKQTSLPRAVGGVVQRFGGQSKVANRIGLIYQGQLVSENGGRTYWTDEKLTQLLLDVATHLGLPEDLMPSYGQVLEFFSVSDDPVYQDKKPPSAIAALTKMGKLHWSEVAKRFNKRFIPGESQKAVTIAYIKAFVRDLGEHLDSLTPSELFVLFQAQGINRGEREKFSRTFDALVDAVQSGMVGKDQLRSWAADHEVEAINDLLDLGAELKEEATLEDREQLLLDRRSRKLVAEFSNSDTVNDVSAEDLPSLEPKAVLSALDKAAELVENSSSDEDKVEFLKAKATAKLWDACFRDEQSLISRLRSLETSCDAYSHEVQQAFLEEYDGAKALEIPSSYAFRDLKGIPREPKLMQRLVAYRLERDMRLLNLSGTGTGKTLSAVFAAQICGSQRVLISCPNGVIDSWRRCFESAYPSAMLHIKPDSWSLEEMGEGVHVVIVNHERFQDRFAQQLLGFCVGFQADLIVIDEIHKSKRRTTEASSQRRKLMNEFIRISINLNPGLRVLGLSATPVINNLYEGRSLIELICQEPFEDISESVDLTSCMNLYQHFVVRGIRMNPGKMPRTEIRLHDVDATPLLPQIVRATKRGSFHDIEQLLVPAKINSLSAMLRRGSKTVVFITYIKNTLEPLCNWLNANHFSFSVFTGDDKDAQEEGFLDSLDEFIRGRSEVLVATIQCAGTGIDGLQSVCNRAIFFQLPWTSTEFEQAVGRLDRDGTDFDSVSIHIPITDIALPDGQRWSWCRSKLDRIESKRDIAKAAVDGEIPDAATLITPSEASKYWLKWLDKLDASNQGC